MEYICYMSSGQGTEGVRPGAGRAYCEKLDRLIVVAPGERSYPIYEKIEAVAVGELARLRGIVAEDGVK